MPYKYPDELFINRVELYRPPMNEHEREKKTSQRYVNKLKNRGSCLDCEHVKIMESFLTEGVDFADPNKEVKQLRVYTISCHINKVIGPTTYGPGAKWIHSYTDKSVINTCDNCPEDVPVFKRCSNCKHSKESFVELEDQTVEGLTITSTVTRKRAVYKCMNQSSELCSKDGIYNASYCRCDKFELKEKKGKK